MKQLKAGDYNMVSINELGVDINSEWTLNEKGDLELIPDEYNIIQSITNRLNIYFDTLNLFYETYGSTLRDFMGWVNNEETLEFINLEIEETLKQDPRYSDSEINSEYTGDGKIEITISISFSEDEEETDEEEDGMTFNLLLGNDGVTTNGSEEAEIEEE